MFNGGIWLWLVQSFTYNFHCMKIVEIRSFFWSIFSCIWNEYRDSKCPNTEFCLVRIFLYSVRIQENTDQKNLRIWILFTQCLILQHLFVVNFRGVLRTLLTLSWRRSLSYKNQPIDLHCKSVDWFLYERDLRHERVKHFWWTNLGSVNTDLFVTNTPFLYLLKTSEDLTVFWYF